MGPRLLRQASLHVSDVPATGSGLESFPAFLAGGGEMGALIRGHDWASTPLGPAQAWPQSLKTAVGIMLTSRQPIWIGWGEQLIYLYNDPYKSIIGGKHPWALGRPTSEIWREIWPDIAPLLATAMGGVEGTYVEEQLLIMERNGYPEETYYTFSYSPIPDDQGAPGGIICANTDDTQRVIGERQLALLRRLATATADARTRAAACERSAAALASDPHDVVFGLIYLLDADGKSVTLAASSGVSPGSPVAPETLSVDDTAIWPIRDALDSPRPVLAPLDGPLGDLAPGAWGRPPAQAALLSIPATGETGGAGVLIVGLNPFRLFNDGYSDFLRLAAGQLSAAIGAADAYEEAERRAEALAELNRAKTAFFSNVSHEFRTPLTLMLGPLEELLSGDVAPDAVQSQVALAHRNGSRLLRLVNSLLDFSRIEAGRVSASFQPTDLAAFSAEVASSFRSAMEKAGLRFELRCEPVPQPVYLDHEMWEKVLLNLLSNAFKFTFTGTISVETGLSPDGRSALVRVSDTGIGVAPEELPRLFERFHRVVGAQGRSFEGSGIGLALVQELVHLHGGEIAAASRPGEGAAFTITLPLGKAHFPAGQVREAAAVAAPQRAHEYVDEAMRWLPEADASRPDGPGSPQPQGRGAGRRVMLADDNVDMRDYVRRLLEAEGYQVEAHADGETALEAARSSPPDLLLTDVMMPRLDGFGLLSAIRGDRATAGVPVIMLSARAGEEARVEGLDAGADDYLIKPFSARELVARVSSHLELARVRREATEALRESEARFRNMADHAPVMMWVTDADGYCTYLNRSWYDFTGQDEVEALGLGWLEAVHPEDREHSGDVFLEASKRSVPFRLEYRLIRADGAVRWAIDAAAPRFSDDGEFLGYIGSVVDITDERMVEAELRRNQTALEEQTRALRIVNRAAAAIAGDLDLERLVGAITDAGVELTGAQFGAFFYNVAEAGGGELRALHPLRRAEGGLLQLPHAPQHRGIRADLRGDQRGLLRGHHPGSPIRPRRASPRHAAGAPAGAQLPRGAGQVAQGRGARRPVLRPRRAGQVLDPVGRPRRRPGQPGGGGHGQRLPVRRRAARAGRAPPRRGRPPGPQRNPGGAGRHRHRRAGQGRGGAAPGPEDGGRGPAHRRGGA